MSRRLDDLDEHLAVLVRLRRRAGSDVYARALLAAKVAVARVVLAEAERLAGRGPRKSDGAVIPFPTIGRRDAGGPAKQNEE